MNTKLSQIKELQSTLADLRKNPKTQRRFPSEVWDAIIQLTESYTIGKICHELQINPQYLRSKIDQFKDQPLEFCEIPASTALPLPDSVIIELSANSGLKAKIQGPASCLSCLNTLFRG